MKIRTRIFLAFIIMMMLGVFTLVRWSQSDMRPRYMEAQEDTLVDIAQLLASIVSTKGIISTGDSGQVVIDTSFLDNAFSELLKRRISAQIYALHKDFVDIRVYVTDAGGKVVFDSERRDLGADYSQWRDVLLTLKGRYGARSTEFDPMFPDGSTMYIAAPIRYKGDIIGVLSVGKPTRNAERFMESAVGKLSYAALWAALAATLIGFILHWWLSRPLKQLQDYSHDVQQGKRVTLPKLGNNEMGMVGEAMEEMRVALDGKRYINNYVQALTHELKSPLAAVKGAAELLAEDMPQEERYRFLSNIVDQTGRMQELIERLLQLAVIENRQTLEQVEKIDVATLLESVKDELHPIALRMQVGISLSVKGKPSLKGDPLLLNVAVANLLKNAIEFSKPYGKVELKSWASEGQVTIEVIDHGIGIPQYADGKIFDRFYSLPRTNGLKGSGLGLSFVKEITALFSGSIGLQKIDRGGTIARLILPVN